MTKQAVQKLDILRDFLIEIASANNIYKEDFKLWDGKKQSKMFNKLNNWDMNYEQSWQDDFNKNISLLYQNVEAIQNIDIRIA